MKRLKKLLVLTFVLSLLFGSVTANVKAEDGYLQDGVNENYDYNFEDEEEAARKAQEAALEAAAAEAARRAAEQVQQYQQEIDYQTQQSNSSVWQTIDEVIEPENGKKNTSAPTTASKTDEEKEEVVADTYVRKEMSASVELGGDSSINVTTKFGALPEGTSLSVRELGDDALLEFASRVGLENVVDGRYFVVNLVDENNEVVTPSKPLTISLNQVDVNGELVNIYAANSETYETYAEGLENSGTVNHVFETKDFDTFVILATGTTQVVEEEPATGIKSFFQKFNIFSSLTNTEEETTLSGRTETEFTNEFESNEKEIELDTENNPAFKASKAIEGTSMQISVDAPAGAFPEGIKLFAEVVETPAEVLQAIEENTGAPATETLTVDVHFYLDEDPNTEIEPIIPIFVTFNNIDVDAELVDVYHETERIDTISNEGGTLELDGFSKYTFTPGPEGETPEDIKIQFTASVSFDDDNNRDGLRQNVKLTLDGRIDGTLVSRTPQEHNVDYLPNFDFGQKGKYYRVDAESPWQGPVVWTLNADDIDGYECTITGPMEGATGTEFHYDVVYKHIPELVNITVTKKWNDKNDIDNLRPENLDLIVLADGENVRQTSISTAENETTVVISGESEDPSAAFYKYRDGGVEVEYSVSESLGELESEYTPSVTPGADGYSFTIVNSHTQKTIKTTVSKVWSGDTGKGTRPASIDLKLLADGELVETITLNNSVSGDTWTTETSEHPVNKPKPDGAKGGDPIEYTIEEVKVPFYYSEVTGNMEDGFTVTNEYIPNTTTVTINKIWVDNEDADGDRPDVAHLMLMNNGDIVKQAQLREQDEWTITFDDVKVYEDPTDADTLINYRVEEANNDGYVVTVEQVGNPVDGYVFEVTNTKKNIVYGTIDVDVLVNWDDSDDADGKRPDSVTVKLLANGEELEPVQELELNKENGYSGTFTELPKYDLTDPENPIEIEYTVEPAEDADVDPYNDDGVTGDMENGFVLNYSYVPATVDIIVEKEWMDENENDRDGIRPEQVTYILLADGIEVAKETVVVEESGAADLTWLEFNKYRDGGIPINYTVIEEDPYPYYPEYEVTETDAEITVKVTNTYDPEKRTITVVKNWDDNDDQDGIRPDSVTINLLVDGEQAYDEYDEPIGATLTAESGWAHNFVVFTNEHLEGEDSKPIEYSVEELELEGDAAGKYTTTYSDFADSGYITVTNKHTPDTGIVILEKEWDDGNNLDGSRPESIIFNLEGYIMSVETNIRIHIPYDETIIMTQDSADSPNKWSKWVELPKFYKGERITYWLTEETVDGYTPNEEIITIQMDNDFAMGEFGFVNVHTPEPVEIEGNVIWRDSDNQDGIRPETVTINLYADGELVETLEVTGDPKENTWPYKFDETYELPKYNKGQLINYTVSEGAIDNYTMRQQGYDFYNSYTPGKTFLTVIKLWDDDRNRDGLRPDNCIIRLLADGKEINRATVSAGTGWFTVFSNLDINKDGKEITYTVEEDKVDKYTTEITGNQKDGFVIKNSHKPETVNVNIKTKWYDDDNKCDKRPGNVIGYLQANGITVDAKWLLPANNWEATIENLPKYAYGKEIVYTISLKALEDYDTVIVGTRAYNYIKGCCGKDACKLCKDCKPNLPKTGVE